MKTRLTAPATMAVFLLCACHKEYSAHSSASARDRAFLTKAAYANRGEIATATMATSKEGGSLVSVYATTIVRDHTTAENDLESLAGSLQVGLPKGTDPAEQPMLQRLGALSGYAFDTAYVRSQGNEHVKEIALFQTEADSGDNSKVRAYASQYLPKLEAHLMMVDSLSTTVH